jgi:RNA polymerase sigma-70 factor (ECF subfamily)
MTPAQYATLPGEPLEPAGRLPAAQRDTRPDLAMLLSRVALGDRSAFALLYRATSGHLLGVAVRIVRDRDRAEEVLQESFIQIWHRASSYSAAIASPMTWLINVLRNKAIDVQRSGRHLRQKPVSIEDHGAADLADDAPNPTELLDEAPARAGVRECLFGLPPRQRQALALAYYEGLTHAAIAAARRTSRRRGSVTSASAVSAIPGDREERRNAGLGNRHLRQHRTTLAANRTHARCVRAIGIGIGADPGGGRSSPDLRSAVSLYESLAGSLGAYATHFPDADEAVMRALPDSMAGLVQSSC